MRNAVDEIAYAPRRFPRLPITDLRNLPENDPLVFEPGLLVQGCSHQLVAPYQSGKTFLALICGKEFMENGLSVLYLDYENRAHSVRERLDVVGTNKERWGNLSYVNCPNLDLTNESQLEWREYLKCFPPDLIIYDSLNGFLSNAGRDENSSTGYQEWSNVYLKIPRALEITTLVLDHTGWDGSHSRGTSRKPDDFDIVWKVDVTRKFSRRDTGQLKLKVLKDRDSLVDRDGLNIVIGGEPFQFQVEAADSMEHDLSSEEKKTFALVTKNSNNQMGTPRKSINELFNRSKSRADRSIKSLLNKNRIYQPEGSTDYWIVDPVSDSSSESLEDSDPNSASDSSVGMASGEGVPGSRSFRTGPPDSAPHTGPDKPLEGTKDENDTNFKEASIADRKSNLAEKVVIRTEDVLEEIETLDFNPRGVEVLKAVASVYLDHPMMTLTTLPPLLEKQRKTIIGLAKQEGVTINSADLDKADSVLRGNSTFVAAIRKRIKKLFDPGRNPYYESDGDDWD